MPGESIEVTETAANYTTAQDWINRFKAAGGRVKVNGISMRLHPDCKLSERYLDLWSQIKGVEHLNRWAEVEAIIKAQVGTVASWNDWPVRGAD